MREKGQSLLNYSNVSSVGIGEKIKNSKTTGEYVIQFTVNEKKSVSQLESEHVVPIPEKIEFKGVAFQTDVIRRRYEVNYRQIANEEMMPDIESKSKDYKEIRRSYNQQLQPGISVSNIGGTAGTLGAIVYDKKNGMPHALSNWHVFHSTHGSIGEALVQPGPYDDPGDSDSNKFGKLVRSFLGLAGDCAIGSILNRDYVQN